VTDREQESAAKTPGRRQSTARSTKGSIKAMELAMEVGGSILLVAQKIEEIADERTYYSARAIPMPPDAVDASDVEAMRALIGQFDQYANLSQKIPPDIPTSLAGTEEPGRVADTVAAQMALKLEQKQKCSRCST